MFRVINSIAIYNYPAVPVGSSLFFSRILPPKDSGLKGYYNLYNNMSNFLLINIQKVPAGGSILRFLKYCLCLSWLSFFLPFPFSGAAIVLIYHYRLNSKNRDGYLISFTLTSYHIRVVAIVDYYTYLWLSAIAGTPVRDLMNESKQYH